MVRRRRAAIGTVAAAAAALTIVACDPFAGRDPTEAVAGSTTPVLVPGDPRFAVTFEFDVAG